MTLSLSSCACNGAITMPSVCPHGGVPMGPTSARHIHHFSRPAVGPSRASVSCTKRRHQLSHHGVLQRSRTSLSASQPSKAGSSQRVQDQPAKLWTSFSSKQSSKPPEPEDERPGWGLLNAEAYSYRWDVPWGPGRVAGGMLLWFVSFVGTGFILVPALYKLADLDIFSLEGGDRATFTLVCQAAETAATLLVIQLLTARPLANAPEEIRNELFNYSPASPLQPPHGWAFWAIVGILASPLVVGAVATLLSSTGYENSMGGRGTVDGVATMLSIDIQTYLSLLTVTGVLAPILEETVFRGFLLTSLTKFMPTWAAITASSVTFGIAHLSVKDLPVLAALGALLGVSYVRSRNLLTPIIIHGAWNSGVLSLLFYLVSSGVDVQQLLQELQAAS